MTSKPVGVPARWTIAILAMALLLSAPAIWNGFPLVFADTGGYLMRAFERELELGRSAFYGVFVAAGTGLNFWPNVALQALLTAWVLSLTLRVHGIASRPLLAVAIVAALALLTGLPWFVGQLMPDIFMPMAVLSLYLLAFQGQALSSLQRAGLLALIAAAIASHMSTLALCLGLLLCLLLLRAVANWLDLQRPAIILPAAATSAGVLLALLSNLIIAHSFAFTPGGATFVFGRLVHDGIIARYLADTCPNAEIKLCAYRDQLPDHADNWLWNYESPLHKLGWWRAYEPEAKRIINDTLRMYPLQHLQTGLESTFEQLVTLQTGEGMHSRDNWHTEGVLRQLAPEAFDTFQQSRQHRDQLHFGWLNAIHVPIALLSTFLLPFAALLSFRGRFSPCAGPLVLVVFIALVGNAAICGLFSNPNNRYQNRIVWLAPFALVIAVLTHNRMQPLRA